MINKGIVSAVSPDGKVSVTPHSGGIVTAWLVVPFYLIGQIPVGTPVIYTAFPDNTGIVIHREDGTGNVTDIDTGDFDISAAVENGVLVVTANGDNRVRAFVEGGVLTLEQVQDCGLRSCIENGVLCVTKDGTGDEGSGGGGVAFTTDETLTLDPDTGVLSVNTADAVEQDNTLPVTSAAVHTAVGNVETLLKLI